LARIFTSSMNMYLEIEENKKSRPQRAAPHCNTKTWEGN
jgi:hypothetical protein